ncbi:hypothetical protein ACP70R_013160 [Stipagrostis hirtigluma subsp. patula]
MAGSPPSPPPDARVKQQQGFCPKFMGVELNTHEPRQLRPYSTAARNTSGNNNLPNYDPQCGMSKEEFEWRCRQVQRVSQSNPELGEVRKLAQRIRLHFKDDPKGLKEWDEYEQEVFDGFENSIQHSFASLPTLPSSVVYEHLRKRYTRPKTYVGMLPGGLDKLKKGTKNKWFVGLGALTLGVGVGLAVGAFTFGPTVRKQQEAKEPRIAGS